jgi:hypothetical protein
MKRDEIAEFFSDQTRLERIDQLHRLLFECLTETEKRLPRDIEKIIDDVAESRSQTHG